MALLYNTDDVAGVTPASLFQIVPAGSLESILFYFFYLIDLFKVYEHVYTPVFYTETVSIGTCHSVSVKFSLYICHSFESSLKRKVHISKYLQRR